MTPNTDRPGQASSYLDYLPAIYQEGAETGRPNFIGRFMLAFEHVLTGLGDVGSPGLEEKLDGIVDPVSGDTLLAGVHRYFDTGPGLPEGERAPACFLEWLSGWVAFPLRADLDDDRKREFIARAVTLYRDRGTKRGLEELVGIYTRLGVTIDEMNTPFQLGVHSTLGEDTLLDGGGPHFFRVILRLHDPDPEQIRHQREVAEAIIAMEKPAHTWYTLEIETPTLQIADQSTVGVDTLLGPPTG